MSTHFLHFTAAADLQKKSRILISKLKISIFHVLLVYIFHETKQKRVNILLSTIHCKTGCKTSLYMIKKFIYVPI